MTGFKRLGRLREDGWVYIYYPSLRCVGCEHPKGGKASVCNFERQETADQYAPLIVKMLNDQ